MRNIFIFFLLFFPACGFAKSKDSLAIRALYEKEQSVAIKSLLMLSGETDSIRNNAAWLLLHTLDTLLQMPGAAEYNFDSLRTKTVSIVEPKDKKFRFFTFNKMSLNGDFAKFGIVELREGKETEIFLLVDTSQRPDKELMTRELETEQWKGALYYQVVPFKNHRKKAYLLIGFDGSTIHSNKKVLDVLWFDRGIPVFGMPVFKESAFTSKVSNRVVYEFHNESHMLMRYEEKRKIIVVDKMAPAFPEAANDFYYYIPTGDYDYYKLNKKGYWVKDALDNFNLGQGVKPKGPVERPTPEKDPQNKPEN